MDQQDLVRFESEAAEVVGAMKELFKEFERHLGEVVSAQRMASSEARAQGAQVTKDLHELRSSARIMVTEQRELLSRLEREWQLRIDETAKRAGEAQAKAFGENIARGLQGKIAELAAEVERVKREFTLKASLRWILGIALAIPLTVGVCVSALESHDEPAGKREAVARNNIEPPGGLPPIMGLTAEQTREAASKLSLCRVPKITGWHVCIDVENPPQVGLGEFDKPRVIVRGM